MSYIYLKPEYTSNQQWRMDSWRNGFLAKYCASLPPRKAFLEAGCSNVRHVEIVVIKIKQFWKEIK